MMDENRMVIEGRDLVPDGGGYEVNGDFYSCNEG